MLRHQRRGQVLLIVCILVSGAWGAPVDVVVVPAGAAVELFEAHVRPVLAERCFGCHGAEKQRGGLRLDSRDALLRGSDAGPVVFMGDPERSPMVLAIRQAGEIKMPPKERLPDQAIEAIAEWIKVGAPWPQGAKAPPADAGAARRAHWAFQPIADPPAPAVQDGAWCATNIDRFVAARLDAHGLAPSPRADRRTLLRRAWVDLAGLPPPVEEVEAFLADGAPDAFERRVDELLASPRFGERWGRHWLDVARYADTKGYVFQEERRYPYAYTYRDYVIRAFNEDLPYDRFLLEQLAADLLPRDGDNRALAAMGFLTLGRRFLNNTPDIIDDRIDLVTRGLMGLTVACARCHDHKYDPVPMADYYSLYGVFASSAEPGDLPLIGPPEDSEAYRAFEQGLREREAEAQKFLEEKRGEVNAENRRRASEYLLAAVEAPPPKPGERRRDVAAGELHPLVIGRWRDHLAEAAKAHHPVLAPWHAFAALPAEERAAKAPALAAAIAANADPQKPVHPAVAAAFAEEPPSSLKDVAARYGKVFAAAEAAPDDAALAPVREVLRGETSPANVPLADIERFINRDMRNGLRERRSKVDRWKATAPGAPPRAMSLAESPAPTDPRIFLRGNASNPGPGVPRQFLAVLTQDRKPFERGSGRLEMAQAIASRDNPLTARVIANRVWMHLTGQPIVRTPGDFGSRCDPPTHPELLDHLASRLIEDGWSLKRLLRRIVLSSAYQQAAEDRPEASAVDAENRLLWKAHRRRLDFEALRDALLAASGRLDLRLGGPAVELTSSPFTGRRTVYGFIDRQNLPGLFRTFDFASPDTTSPRRHETTVPQQALFLLNSPFAVEQARALAARAAARADRSPMDRVRELYRLGLGRSPDSDEIALAMEYVQRGPDAGAGAGASLDRWERLAQALLLTNELAYLD